MDAIKFGRGEVAFVEGTFGGLKTDELNVKYDSLDQYEIELELEGKVRLDELISGGKGQTPTLDLTALPTNAAKIREASKSSENSRSTIEDLIGEINLKSQQNDIPSVPKVTSLPTETDETHYKRLRDNPDSQPAVYRRLIRNESEIVRRKFDKWAKRRGYDPEGGSHSASLLMLERIGEIRREGKGDDQRIIWDGE